MTANAAAGQAAKESSGPAAAAAAEDGWSLKWRIGFFSVFAVTGSVASVAYTLKTDEAMLFMAQESYPGVVRALAPYIGLPVVEETGELDEEAYFPRHISELVGETVQVACTTRAGQVHVVEAPADADEKTVYRLLEERLGPGSLSADPVATIAFVDADEATSLLNMTAEEKQLQVGEALGLQIAPVPPPGVLSKTDLHNLLVYYRDRELAVKTQIALGQNHGFATPLHDAALDKIELFKTEIKQRLKSGRY